MPAFLDVLPPFGQNVEVTLANGSVFMAYFDGSQWWTGVPDSPDDVPLANDFVVSWREYD